MKKKRIGRKIFCLVVSLVMIMTLIPRTSVDLAYAADDDYPVPDTSKELIDNGDGTYTLKLSVTGSAKTETENPKVNVVFVMDRSGSMQETTGQSGYPVAQYGRYGKENGEYVQLYYRSTYSGNYNEVGNNDNHGTVYVRTGTPGNYTYTQYNGVRYSTSNNMRRDQVAIAAASDLADSLLSYNTASNPDTVEMAFVSFNDMASSGNSGNWTTSASTAENVIRGYTYQNNTGTNWEDALIDAKALADAKHTAQPDEQMFIIFLTDGNPTRYVNDQGNQAGNGQETAANIATCYNEAAPRARALTDAGYEMYNIGVFGNVDRMEDLTDYSNESTAANHATATYYPASNASALEAAFAEILRAITNSLSLADVKFTDGVTDMTHSTGVNGQPGNFQYTITVNGVEEPWDDAPRATVNENKEVIWDLSKDKDGNDLTIADGVTVTCSFLVWPDQDAMDLIADLNNNKITYDSLTDAQKAQIQGSEGNYSLKTNTTAKLEYSILENNDGTITKIPQEPITLTPPDPMPLFIDKLSLEKKWDDSLDPDQREEVEGEVVLDLYKDNDKYILPGYEDGITLTEAENWIKTDFLSIATGIMVSEDSPAYDESQYPVVEYNGKTYCILETGHDYHFQEQDINNHYELTAYTYHPMLVDGVLHNLTFEKDDEGNITGVSEGAAISTVSATNTIKGGISIRKKVVDVDGNEIDSDEPFTITMNMLDENGDPYSYDYRIYYGEKNPEYESHIVYNADGTVKYSRTDHIYGTSPETVTIYPGDEIRFVNVDAGTRYYVSEEEAVGYDLDGIEYKVRYGDDPTLVDFTAEQKETINGTTYYIMEGNSSGSVVVTNVKNNGDLKVAKTVVNGDTDKAFTFTLDLKDDEGAAVEGEFDYVIYKASDDSEVSDGTIENGGTFTLKDGQYIIIEGLPTGTEYTVTETAEDGYTTTVDGTETNAATGTIVLDDPDTTTVEMASTGFTNTYDATGTAVLKVIKELSGSDWPEGKTLTFTLSGTGGTLPETKTATLSAPGTATFGAITYGLEDIGKTYTYTISEDGFGSGWTGSGNVTATVVVTDNGDGTLATAVTYNPTNDTITNTYDASGNATINVTKTITGAAWPTGKTITLTLEGANNAPMPTTTTATLSAAGNASFGPISYGLSDAGKTYTYTISEDGFGDGWTGSGDVTATVTVTDNGDGTLATSVTYSPENATITNTYEATGTATLEATKAIEGAAWPQGKTITFTLAGEGGTLPETKTVSLSAPGTATFGDITYDESDAGKTYTYTITEDGFGAGWTGSPNSITATVVVTDNGDGTLATEITYDPEDATFTNTYEAEGTAVLEAIKEISGAAWPEGQSITFTLAGEGGTLPETKTVTLTEPGTATFGAITYDESDAGQTYTYTITENGFGDGWTADPGKVITATVVVTDNGDGTLATAISYDPTDDTIINTYVAEGEAVLKAKKALTGRAWLEGESYTFTLTAKTEGAPMPEEGTTVEFTADGEASFGKIVYDESDAGKTYQYTISETSELPGGITKSDDITATVVVTDNGDGTLKTEITYDPESDTITNTYDAEGTAQLKAKKALVGRAWLDNESYTFTLTGNDGAPMPEEGTTATYTADGEKNFGTITYTEEDMVDETGAPVTEKTFTYTISETSELPDGITKSADITATVVVTDNGDGTLSTEIKYSPENDTITNTYKATGKVEIQATKELVGRDWLEGETFTFTLKDADGEELESKTVSKDQPVAEFTAIPYTEADAGKTFTYTVEETSNLPGGIKTPNTVTVTVEVTDNGDGTLSTSASYTNDGKIVNDYDAQGEIVLEAAKELEGREWQENETYTFTLYDAEGNVIDEVTVDSNETVSFKEIEYTEADMVDENGNPVTEKTFEYTIEETTTLPGGMTNSGEITATVTVVDNGDGTLTTSVEYDKDDTIINTYRSEGEAVIKAKKALEGRPWLDGEKYTFTLSASTEGAPMPEEGTTVEFTEDGEKNFGAIKYTQEDMLVDGKYATEKTYEYTISETSELPAGVTKSDDIRVTVKLTDNGDGTITADITYDPDNTITNTYKAKPVEATIDVTKTIDGYVSNVSGSSDSTFEFTLYDKDGKQVGDKISITTEDGKGKASFKAIEYDEAGTYNYTVKETVGDKAGYTYSTKTYPVTVTVTDNYKEAQLEASVSYGEDGTATSVDVVNEFDFTDVEVTLTLTKTIEDQSDSAPDSTFTFKLYKDSVSDENLVDTKKITTEDLKGSVEFDKLKFEASGEYTYIVVEEAGDEAGFTYDTKEHTYKIIIDDDFEAAVLKVNEDSTLEAEITNVYKAKETSTILQVNKEINDTSDSAYDTTFTFTLTGPDGYTDETSVKGAGTAEFKAITYKKAGTYEYTIKETAGNAAGYEYDTKEYKVTVTVEDQNGQLIATAAYMDETGAAKTELSITNTYDPEDASVILEATKKVADKTGGATAKTFKFELLDADGKVIDTATREGAGKVTFGEITYEKVGTYNYSIREVAGTDKGYEYDTNEYKVTVEVTDAGDGNLKAAVTSEGGVTITNTYTAEPVKVGVEVTKKLTGRDLRDGEFTFQLKKGDEVVAEATNDADGKVAFKKLTFKKAGTYEYTVAEVAGDLRGVKYDKNEYPVTITVTDDGEGALKAEITSEDVTFSNKFTEKKRDITVTKVWDDEDNLDGTRPETVTINLMADGEKVKSAKLSEENDWTYTFEGLNYYNADDSKIKYTVEEKKVSGYKAKVTGTMSDGFTVTNSHEPGAPTPVSYDPPVIKYVEGDEAPEDDEFTFKLEAISGPEGEDIPMPEGSEDGVKEMSTVAGEEKEFGDIEFTVPGTYVYEITEVDTELEGYTYDESVYTLTFVVTRNDANELEYELTIEKDGEEYDSDVSAFEFTNEYEEPAKPVKPAKTGDTTMIMNYVILFGASIMLLLALLLRRRNAHK